MCLAVFFFAYVGEVGEQGGLATMTQARRNQQRLERSRRIMASRVAAKVIARATGHKVVDGCDEYVPLTGASVTHRDAGTWNFARGEGFGR